jgi:hypothetical protein
MNVQIANYVSSLNSESDKNSGENNHFFYNNLMSIMEQQDCNIELQDNLLHNQFCLISNMMSISLYEWPEKVKECIHIIWSS